jgi:hypothetical protein
VPEGWIKQPQVQHALARLTPNTAKKAIPMPARPG